MAESVNVKPFKNGGSMAIRIPAGWLDPNQEVTLTRDPDTKRITLNQRGAEMSALLLSWLALPEIEDDGFTEALHREPQTDQRSIFEIQEAEEGSRAAD